MPRKHAAGRVVLKGRRIFARSSGGVQHEKGGSHAHTVLHLVAPQHWERTLGNAEDTHLTSTVQNEPGQVSRRTVLRSLLQNSSRSARRMSRRVYWSLGFLGLGQNH